MKLKRNISNLGLLSTAICGMVGSGWLFGSIIAVKYAGPAAIISWLIGGVFVAFIAAPFAELATMAPVTGGSVRYIHFSHGSLASFCVNWLTWLSCVAVAPTEVIAALHYCNNFYPSLIKGDNITPIGIFWSIILLFALTVLNFNATEKINWILTKIGSWKVAVPIITALCLLATKFDATNFTFMKFAPYGLEGIFTAISTIVVFSFLGFVEAISLIGEAKNPRKAVPLTIIGSIGITLLIYTLLQIAFIGSVNHTMIGNGWNLINFSGQFGPFAGIATTLGLGVLAGLIYTDAIISPIGTGFAYTATTARINYGMSANNYAPKVMQKLNKNGIPHISIIFNFLIGVILLIPFSNWEEIVKFQTAAIMIAYATGPISLLALRDQAPDKKRPFKLPLHNLLCFVAFFLINMILYWSGWVTILRIMVGIVIGLIYFGALIYFSKQKTKIMGSIYWLAIYFVGMTVISYFGSFEGTGEIGFGYDVALIAIFTYIVIKLSYFEKLSPSQTLSLIQLD